MKWVSKHHSQPNTIQGGAQKHDGGVVTTWGREPGHLEPITWEEGGRDKMKTKKERQKQSS